MQYSTPIETAKSHNAMFAIAGMAGGKCSVVPIDGDNMEPTLFKGDAALTDTGIDEYQGEGLYVLDWFGVPTVYRLQAGFPGKGTILINRDNPVYESTELTRSELNDMILGKVIAIGKVIDRRGDATHFREPEGKLAEPGRRQPHPAPSPKTKPQRLEYRTWKRISHDGEQLKPSQWGLRPQSSPPRRWRTSMPTPN